MGHQHGKDIESARGKRRVERGGGQVPHGLVMHISSKETNWGTDAVRRASRQLERGERRAARVVGSPATEREGVEG